MTRQGAAAAIPQMITAQISLPVDDLVRLLASQISMPVDRMGTMVSKYGEACRKSKAAEILGVSPQTIRRMLDDGKLRATSDGELVDVRSIYEYIEHKPAIDRMTRSEKLLATRAKG